MIARTRKLRDRLLGPPRPVESLVRNILAVGFIVLLLLVAGVGYRSIQSLVRLEKESVRVDETEEFHLRVVLGLSETVGKISTQAQTVAANRENSQMHFASSQQLKELKNEAESEIREVRQSSLVDSEEWRVFEASYNAFWEAMDRLDQTPNDEWHDARDQMKAAVKEVAHLVDREQRENNVIGHQMSVSARNRIVAATGAVLMVGVVVAALAFYEIRKNLKRLAGAYAASAESRDYLQSLLDSLVSGVVVIDQDGVVRTVSESFRRLPGAGAERQGQSYTELFRNNASLRAAVTEELAHTEAKSRYYGRVDLGESLFDVFSSPLMSGGERRGVILVFVDVTETARAQAELRRNHALTAVGQMTTQIAHEIKNPLGSIRFAAEVLKRRGAAANPDDLSTIQVIERSVDHLAAICAELSEFARPKMLNRVETDLNSLLDDLLPMVADRLAAKQMRITKNYSAEIPPGYYDGTELRKLFLNLVINAVEASEPLSSIELRTRVNGSEDVLIDIVDHGSGMDSETLKRLFEPFYTTKEKGTGLGMAIAKRIAELHNGDLSVMSRAGAGTTVTVRLPSTKFAEADNRIGAVNRLST